MIHLKTFEDINKNSIIASINSKFKFDYIESIISTVDVNEVDTSGNNALCRLSMFDQISDEEYNIAKLLIEYGININCTNNDGNSPLIYASYVPPNEKLIMLYIDNDADWNIKDNSGMCFLDYVDHNLKYKIIKKYPDKYEDFLVRKEGDKYNL